MPLFAELLYAVGEASRGVYGGAPDAGFTRVERWDRPAAVRSWRAWAEARCAFRREDLHDCSRWLAAAERLAGPQPDEVCAGEMDLLWAEVWNHEDEPRRAMPRAQAAWHLWFRIAQNSLPVLSSGTLRALLDALTFPETFDMTDQQLFMEWLGDCAAVNLNRSAAQIFAACAGLKIADPALELAAELRDWYDRTSKLGGLQREQIAPLAASLLQQVANLHDKLGNAQLSLNTFIEARAMLADSNSDADDGELRRIDFNIANQLGKLGRHAEAVKEYKKVIQAFSGAGEEEPALRAQHALLLSQWEQLHDSSLVVDPLQQIILRYEMLLQQSESRRKQNEIHQNLNAANALWISVTAASLASAASPERFLYQVFANREGKANAHTLWQSARSDGNHPELLNQMSLLVSRLSEETDELVILSLESGVGELFALTLRSGDLPLSARLEVDRLDSSAVDALLAALLARRDAAAAIASGEISAASSPNPQFHSACSDLWQKLPAKTRQRIAGASTIYFVPDPGNDLDEVPLELVHDGNNYLGLSKVIVRASSWSQLAASFSRNRVDNFPTGRIAIVRGGDSLQLGALRLADQEVTAVETRAAKTFTKIDVLREPSSAELLSLLEEGVDVLHFTGHSFADQAGEHLILATGTGIGVPEFDSPRSTPAPISIFCSCLVGLHRKTLRGRARGIAASLLAGGSPAVVAAMVPVPDQVGHDFAVAVHFHAQTRPIGEAVRAARVTLARRLHPATWGCFALFGRHSPSFLARASAPPLTWPVLLVRCMATRGAAWRQEFESAVAMDTALDPSLRKRLLALLNTFAGKRKATRLPRVNDEITRNLGAEARLALEAAEALAEATASRSEDAARDLISRALLIHQITEDNYLLVSVVETAIRTGVLLVQDESGEALLNQAIIRAGWLSHSAAALQEPLNALHKVRERWNTQITMQAHENAGVSGELFQRADQGDRDAQKEMVWNLMAQSASLEARTSDRPWTEWLYREMGAGSREADADLCGAIDAAARSGRLPADSAEALRTLFKRYVGPGEIEPEHVEAALALFADQREERRAVQLFQLYDRITSQETPVSSDEFAWGVAEAAAAGASGLVAFIELQQASRALEAGNIESSRELALDAVARFASLTEDPVFQERMNLAAALLYSVAERSGDPTFRNFVLMAYQKNIEAYAKSHS
jgi:hypothetical protein